MAQVRLLKRLMAALILIGAVVSMSVSSGLAAPPAWMQGFPMRAGNIILGMFIPVPGATEYKVLKKVEGGEFKVIYQGPVNNFNDPDADPTKTYTYKVIPIIGGKEGEPSAEAVLAGKEKIKPPEIGGVLVTERGIQLRWNVVLGAAFYNLYRSEGRDGNYKMLKSLQDTAFSDTEAKPEISYFYQVTAVDKSSVESERSKVVMGKVEKRQEVRAIDIVHKKVKKIGEFEGERLYELANPTAMVVDSDGTIYVDERKGVQIFKPTGEYLRRIKFPSDWSEPFGMIFDSSGNLVIAFPYEAKVRVISKAEGALVKQFVIGLPKLYAGKNIVPRPGSMAFDGEGNLWVADGAVWQLVILNPMGEEIGRVGKLREEVATKQGETDFPPDYFPGMGGVKYNPFDGKMYLILSVSAEFKVIDAKSRKVEATYGGLGSSVNQFSGIAGFGFRKNGNFLTYDNLLSEVKEFSPKFEYVQTYGDILTKAKKPTFSMLASSFMAFREETEELFFVSRISNKVTMFRIE